MKLLAFKNTMENGIHKVKSFLFKHCPVRLVYCMLIIAAEKAHMKPMQHMKNHQSSFLRMFNLKLTGLFTFLKNVRHTSNLILDKCRKQILKDRFNIVPSLLVNMTEIIETFG